MYNYEYLATVYCVKFIQYGYSLPYFLSQKKELPKQLLTNNQKKRNEVYTSNHMH